MMYRFFSQTDFSGANPTCSIDDMGTSFMTRLDQAREYAGIPFVVNSAYRTVEHEIEQGRDGTSSHTKGIAVDLACKGSRQRYLMIHALLKVGFTRIGIGETFLHVDTDEDKDQNVIWHYYK